MNFIINPVNNKQYSIQSKDGKQLLQNYINLFLKKKGGTLCDDKVEFNGDDIFNLEFLDGKNSRTEHPYTLCFKMGDYYYAPNNIALTITNSTKNIVYYNVGEIDKNNFLTNDEIILFDSLCENDKAEQCFSGRYQYYYIRKKDFNIEKWWLGWTDENSEEVEAS